MKKYFVVGNWKMNPGSLSEARRVLSEVKKGLARTKISFSRVKIILCPPFPYLFALPPKAPLALGAQDVFWINPGSARGAYTGEVSLEMLKNMGADYVIVGHSERRGYLSEDNAVVNKKLSIVLKSGLNAIFCVGEREEGKDQHSLNYVKEELARGLEGIGREYMKNLIVAYEPVWALSTSVKGHVASPEHAFKMAIFIRRTLLPIVGETMAKNIPILYGGSVSSKTVKDFLPDGWMQGVLVGSKSLDAKDFVRICEIANRP